MIKPEAIQKAETNLASITAGGILLEQQADRFIRVLQKRPGILPEANVQALRSPIQRAENLRFSGRILRAAVEGTGVSEADKVAPDFGFAQFNAKEFIASIPMTLSAIEDNIEGDSLIETVLSAASSAVARDVEEVVVRGDTASPDAFLASWDGMLASATSNIYNASGSRFDPVVATGMINTLPEEFRSDKLGMRYYLDHNSDSNARLDNAGRATPLGDNDLVNYNMIRYGGVPVQPVDVWPRNLGGGGNETEVILTSTKNIGVGVWRQLQIASDYDAQARRMIFVLTCRVAFTYLFEPAVVKATNVLAA